MTPLDSQTRGQELIRKSLTYSVFDGVFFAVMFGMSESFFQAYGIHLGADDFALGLIKTLPITVGSLAQLFAGFFLRRFKSRRLFTALFSLLHALMFLPLIFCAFLGAFAVPGVIMALCLISFFFLTPVPAWASWMGDLTEEKTRGGYFGRRTSITGVVSFLSLLAAGFILQSARGAGAEFTGFAVIFSIALVGRAASAFFLSRKYDPHYDYSPKKFIDFGALRKHSRKSGVFALIGFLSALNFALMFIAPYIDVYLLKHLELDYVSFTAANATILGVKYLFMPFWGKACDRYGTRKVLLTGAALVSLVPLGWIFATAIPVIIVLQACAGFAWAAFEIASFNMVIEATSQKNRASWVALQNTASGLIGLAGSFTAGALLALGRLLFPAAGTAGMGQAAPGPLFFLSPYFFIFLGSGLIRVILLFIFHRRLKEMRSVRHIRARRLPLRVIGMLTNRGVVLGISILSRIRKKGKKTDAEGAPASVPKKKSAARSVRPQGD